MTYKLFFLDSLHGFITKFLEVSVLQFINSPELPLSLYRITKRAKVDL